MGGVVSAPAQLDGYVDAKAPPLRDGSEGAAPAQLNGYVGATVPPQMDGGVASQSLTQLDGGSVTQETSHLNGHEDGQKNGRFILESIGRATARLGGRVSPEQPTQQLGGEMGGGCQKR